MDRDVSVNGFRGMGDRLHPTAHSMPEWTPDSGPDISSDHDSIETELSVEASERTPPFTPTAAARPTTVDYGPCLYLGPAGQRCQKRAMDGGFCATHRPAKSRADGSPDRPVRSSFFAGSPGAAPDVSDAPPVTSGKIARRGAALFAALAVLFPLLLDFIRELIRLLR